MITKWFEKAVLEATTGKPITMDKNTTLNEKYNILIDKNTIQYSIPVMRYYGIGIGGIGTGLRNAYHKGVDGDLFEPIPFIGRLLIDDIPVADRIAYRMRVIKIINGISYVFYYLKCIVVNKEPVRIRELIKLPNTTTVSTAKFSTTTATILNPEPALVDEVNLDRVSYHVIEVNIAVTLTDADKAEVVNAYRLLLNDPTLEIPLVTEMCIYTGIDEVSDSIHEAYAVRAAYFYAVPYIIQPMLSTVGTFQRYINVGGMRLT